MELEEARDVLANCIDDYVIAEYCSSCDDKESCKDDDCIFSKAIEVVLNHLTKQEKMIDLMSKLIKADDIDEDICQYEGICNEYECEECIKQYFEKKAEESE